MGEALARVTWIHPQKLNTEKKKKNMFYSSFFKHRETLEKFIQIHFEVPNIIRNFPVVKYQV